MARPTPIPKAALVHVRRHVRTACDIVAAALDLSPIELEGPTRGRAEAALGRQIAMYLAHCCCGLSLNAVAAGFGRDRSTVTHALHLIEDRRDDPAFDALLADMELAARERTRLDGALQDKAARWRGEGRAAA